MMTKRKERAHRGKIRMKRCGVERSHEKKQIWRRKEERRRDEKSGERRCSI